MARTTVPPGSPPVRTRRLGRRSTPRRRPTRLQPAGSAATEPTHRGGEGSANAYVHHVDSLSPVLTGSGSEGLRLVRTLSTPARAPLSSCFQRLAGPRAAGLRCAHAEPPPRPARPPSSRSCAASRELDDEPAERARVEAWHRDRSTASLPTRAVPRLRAAVGRHGRPTSASRAYVLTPRDGRVTRTLYYVHGGGYMAPIDAFHVRYATRLADAIGARVVMPDYPLAPEHTWRDSHDALVERRRALGGPEGGAVLAGDSAGGGLALAMALSMRDRGLAAGDATWCCTRPGWTSPPRPRRPSRSTRSTRGCSSARCRRTPSGGRARPTTSAVPRSPRRSATSPGCRRP